MITRVPGVYWPKDSMPVWRYLSFDKFVNFMMHREVQFTRSSLFTDQNELRLLDAPEGKPEMTGEQAARVEQRIENLRSSTFVSCWSLGVSESYPLWKIYLGGSRNGVAIRSTVGKLRASLESSPTQYFDGGVQYRREVFDKNPTDEQLICTKLEAYAYEREYRVFAIFPRHLTPKTEGKSAFTPNVISEPIDVASMLRFIYVSPFSSSWFEKTVRDAMTRLAPDLTVSIRKSKIRDQ
jgi:hypothetical protein